jgi:hypothetical protein
VPNQVAKVFPCLFLQQRLKDEENLKDTVLMGVQLDFTHIRLRWLLMHFIMSVGDRVTTIVKNRG